MSNYMSQKSKGRCCQNHLSEHEIRHSSFAEDGGSFRDKVSFNEGKKPPFKKKKKRKKEKKRKKKSERGQGRERVRILSISVSQLFAQQISIPEHLAATVNGRLSFTFSA